jgi:ABC-type transport system involved in cytochrome bd biosynthesis fused ATPase/permease subunit
LLQNNEFKLLLKYEVLLMKKFIKSLKDLIQLSRLTKTKNKKIRIILTALLSNFIVLCDIIVITTLTSIFSDDNYLDNFFVNLFVENLIYLPLVVVLRFSSIYFEKMNVIKLKIDIEENLRGHLMTEIFDKGNYSPADAYFYVNTISNQVASFYGTFATFLGSALQIIAYSSYLLLTNTETVFIFLIGIIILLFPTLYLTKLGRKYSHKTYLYGQDISLEIEKALDNLYLIKIINYVDVEMKKFKKSLENFYSSSLNNLRFGTINAIIPNFLTIFIISILVVFFNFASKLTLDFIGILLRLFQALGVFNSNFHLLNAYHIYTEKLFQIESNKIKSKKENYSHNENLDKNIAIKFTNMSFRYFNQDKSLFENVNLVIKRDKHTILTGPNGSGKSTLLALASGIVYPHTGTTEVFTKSFSYVSATPMILNSTLRDNLVYGVSEAASDELLKELIIEFKLFGDKVDNQILDQLVSNKKLSTGQMQKISFIRAILSKADILLLDESTSNLDISSKKLIFNNLSTRKLTIINATHNPEEFLHYDEHLKIVIENEKRKFLITPPK